MSKFAIFWAVLGNIEGLSKREIRWTEFLADFHFSTHHIPGKENGADSLTRQGETTTEAEVCSLEFFLDVHPNYAEEISEGCPQILSCHTL